MSKAINIIVCSREDAANYPEISHTLSLLDPERRGDTASGPKRRLLLFHDIDDIEVRAPKYKWCVAPREKHIKEIFRFFDEMYESESTGIVVHCEAGISRSSAGAILGLVSLGMPPEGAFETVYGLNEFSLPNRRMLRIGGNMLGDNGRMLELADARRRALFAKYGQEDPTDVLWRKTKATGRVSLRLQYTQTWFQTMGKRLKAISDDEMWSRLKTKADRLAERASRYGF